MPATRNSFSQTPDFSPHRVGVTATDTLPVTVMAEGVDTRGYESAILDINVLAGASAITINVHFWSDDAAAFVPQNPAVTLTGISADCQFVFACLGRRFFVAVTAITGPGSGVNVRVAGSERQVSFD